METLGMYLLKSSIWLTGFGLIYLIFLRNERYFLLNRIFLLSGLVASILFPLLSWHYTIVIPVRNFPANFEAQISSIPVVDQAEIYRQILQFLYLSGVIYLLFRISKQTSLLLGVIKKSTSQSFKSVKLIRTNDYPVSFSFFSFVFVNPSINDTETNEIVNHEMEHVRQRHWIDLVLFEILCTLQWFNPMIWFYGRFIRQNHEYLADERALQHSSNPALYRAALLNQLLGGSVIALAHSFNYSLNTKRFNMMKNKIYSPIRKLKLLLVLPLIAMVFYAFATPEFEYTEQISKKTEAELVPQTQEKSTKDTIKTTISFVSPLDSNKLKKETRVNRDTRSDKRSDTRKEEVVRIGGSGKQPLIIVDGVELKSQNIKDLNPDNIASISVLKDKSATILYGDKGRDGVILITMKHKKFTSNINKSEPIAVAGYGKSDSLSAIHRFIKTTNGVVVEEKFHAKPDEKFDTKFDGSAGNRQPIKIRGVGVQPLIIVDGVIIENQIIENIPPDDIKSVNIWKGDKATAKYGPKAGNGVIEVTMKKEKSSGTANTPDQYTVVVDKLKGTNNDGEPEKISVESGLFKNLTGNKKPLIVKDGIIAEDQNIKEFGTSETIDKITLLNGKEATDKYGEKGINGVIEMITKKK